jgi:molybdenum cofactor cytidylyltransferase
MTTPTTAAVSGCVVLAAGSSRRFGSDKRRFMLPGGSTLLEQTLATVRMVFARRVLVLRAEDKELAAHYRDDWQIVLATDASMGMGHSLAAALPALTGWPGAVIALADMAWVQPQSFVAVEAALRPDLLVVPYHNGERGNPVGIGSDYFGQLANPQGDSGARQLFGEFRDKVIRLELDDPGILQDLDIQPTDGIRPYP